jgi:tetratricopeptide (TPR) repeat protein
VAARPAATPNYLRTLLEELRLFGNHEQLSARISHYLEAPAVDQLFAKDLQRFELDYEHNRPGLVRAALSALWASRNGLSEPEMLDLLGTPASPLPSAYWSPLSLALGGSLVIRSGLLGFFHPGLRDAVAMRYLAAPEQRRGVHRRLAAYFAGRGMTRRRVEERPWQLAEAGDWSELADELAEPAFLEVAWPIQPFEIKAAWARLEAQGAARIVEHHRRILENPDAYPRCTWAVAVLLGDTGHQREALALTVPLEGAARSARDPGRLQASLGLRARLLRERGELDGALEALRQQEAVCRPWGDRAALAACLGGQGIVLRDRGDLDAASALFLEEKALCEAIDDLAGLAANLGHRGIVAALRQSRDEAIGLFREQEAICRRLGDLATLGEALGNLGVVLRALGRFGEAAAQHREEEQICRRLNDWSGLQVSLGHQARIAQESEDYDGALRLLEEQEAILRNRLDNPLAMAWTLFQQAFLFAERLGEPRHALALAEEAHRLVSQPRLYAGRDDDRLLASPRATRDGEGLSRVGLSQAAQDSPARQIEALLASIRDRLCY